MEWNNYLELEHNPDLYNKYLLNLNENLDSNYSYNNNNNNFNYYKKYIPNYKMENFQEENNNNIDYFNIINNIQNPISELYNLDENSYLSPINYEESEEKKMNKLSESFNNENKENNKKKLFKTQTFSSVTIINER